MRFPAATIGGMFATNTYVIRKVTGQQPLDGPALVGEIDGRPAAAISLTDGRVVTDPFQRTTNLVMLLRMRARGLAAAAQMPLLSDRLRAVFS
jgi:hypothetical protein